MPQPTPTPELPAANARAAQAFDDIADLLEMRGENVFRVRAYRTAARELRQLSRDVGEMLEEGADLTKLRGIGADLAEKIQEIVETGQCEALAELHEGLPESLHEVLRLPGLGAKRVKVLYDKLGVRSLDDLSKAAEGQRIRDLPGFGEKSERKILDAIAGALGVGRRMGLAAVRPEAERLVARLEAARGVKKVVVAGSYRRGRATVGDLDILVTANVENDAAQVFVDDDRVARVLAHGEARSTILLRSGLQVDLRVLRPESFGAALHYFTGSKSHNIAIRTLALKRKLKLNEYGVFRGERRVAGRTEESVFATVDLPFIPPELRENRGEIEAAREDRLPDLVGHDDLLGDFVRLPPYTVVRTAVERALEAAGQHGLEYVVMLHEPDEAHPRRWEALRDRMETVDEMGNEAELELVQGLEVSIDSELELPDEVRSLADLVVATMTVSQHAAHPSKAALKALEALHPEGLRLVIRELDPTQEPGGDLGRLLDGAIDHTKFLLIDGTADQLGAAEPLLRFIEPRDVPVVLASGDLEEAPAALDLALTQARRAWIEAPGVLNTHPWPDAQTVLRPKKNRKH